MSRMTSIAEDPAREDIPRRPQFSGSSALVATPELDRQVKEATLVAQLAKGAS